MVAWEVELKSKRAGGLGLTAFRDLSLAMRTKQLTKLFTHQEEEWVGAAEQLIRSVNNRGMEGREHQAWSIQETILLQPPKRIPGALRPRGCSTTGTNQETDLKLERIRSSLTRACRLRRPSCSRKYMDGFPERKEREPNNWRDATGLRKEMDETSYQALESPSTEQRSGLVLEITPACPPNPRQNIEVDPGRWKCCRCNREKETLEHLLIDCVDSQTVWAEWQTKTRRSKLEWNQIGDFIDMLDEAWKDQNWAKVTLFIKCTWRTWLDRNAITYNAQRRRTPLKVAAIQAAYTLEAILQSTDEKSNKHLKLKSVVELLGMAFDEQEVQLREMNQSLIENTQVIHSVRANEELASNPTNQYAAQPTVTDRPTA
ncbi:hypothetical protein R1sor_007231 [Riccia sorocarpa]|uniref:Reverse transcriptase zinc-binding domain-containing protein n=1 Tax=Riccia sorocarpa TaxID=122646 RepID=A0ABD3HTI0_9MARC